MAAKKIVPISLERLLDSSVREKRPVPAIEGSAITDEMRRMVGVDVGPQIYQVTEDLVYRFIDAVEDPNPLWHDAEYAGKTGHGGIICPPAFLLALEQKEQLRWVRVVDCPLKRVFYGAAEFTYHQQIRPGDTIRVYGKLVDIQEKGGKSGKLVMLVMDRTYVSQRGEIVARGRSTFIRT